jgi:hypothetical protein
MTQYRPGTGIEFTDEDYIEQTLARLSRIAYKGMADHRYTFLTHEAKEVLIELVKEIRTTPEPKDEKIDVFDTQFRPHFDIT